MSTVKISASTILAAFGELAAQWRSMADQAAKMLSDESELGFSAPRDRQMVRGCR